MSGLPHARIWLAIGLVAGLLRCIALEPIVGGLCDPSQNLGCAEGWSCIGGQCVLPTLPFDSGLPDANIRDSGTPDSGFVPKIWVDNFEEYDAGPLPTRFGLWQLDDGSAAAIDLSSPSGSKRLLLMGTARWVNLETQTLSVGLTCDVRGSDQAMVSLGAFTLGLSESSWSAQGAFGVLDGGSPPGGHLVQLTFYKGEVSAQVDKAQLGSWQWAGSSSPLVLSAFGAAWFDDVYGWQQ
jgi:hypothetical protein